jgi:hypothetical protein
MAAHAKEGAVESASGRTPSDLPLVKRSFINELTDSLVDEEIFERDELYCVVGDWIETEIKGTADPNHWDREL